MSVPAEFCQKPPPDYGVVPALVERPALVDATTTSPLTDGVSRSYNGNNTWKEGDRVRRVTLEELFTDSICRKHLPRAGVDHSIRVAELAVDLAERMGVDPDLAAKAGLLHDIGHGDFYVGGAWNYQLYQRGDIHPIKGAERAHELLMLKGEDPAAARDIALAILFHSGSTPIRPVSDPTPLQRLLSAADDGDEEERGDHHRRKISFDRALERVRALDRWVEALLDERVGERLQRP